jgi:hypothetical protein
MVLGCLIVQIYPLYILKQEALIVEFGEVNGFEGGECEKYCHT